MKKIILLTCIAAAIAFSSCGDDGKPHCWQMTVEYKGISGILVKDIAYAWKTADEIDVMLTNSKVFLEALGATDVKTTKKKVKLSEEDCKAQGIV